MNLESLNLDALRCIAEFLHYFDYVYLLRVSKRMNELKFLNTWKKIELFKLMFDEGKTYFGQMHLQCISPYAIHFGQNDVLKCVLNGSDEFIMRYGEKHIDISPNILKIVYERDNVNAFELLYDAFVTNGQLFEPYSLLRNEFICAFNIAFIYRKWNIIESMCRCHKNNPTDLSKLWNDQAKECFSKIRRAKKINNYLQWCGALLFVVGFNVDGYISVHCTRAKYLFALVVFMIFVVTMFVLVIVNTVIIDKLRIDSGTWKILDKELI